MSVFMDLSKVTLYQLIELNKKLKPLDVKYKEIIDSDFSEAHKDILLTTCFVNKAKITFEYLGESTSDISKLSVDSLVSWYTDFIAAFDVMLEDKWWVSIGLSEPVLNHLSPITFGQFIDAKMIVEASIRAESDKWQVMQYVMSIFLIPRKREYEDVYTSETSPQFIRQGKKDVMSAIRVSKWWDTLNANINSNYTVFQDSGDRSEHSDNIDAHMERWGWVNFLKTLAKTKAFDISGSGLNSIDCVRKTKASEILAWASEEKEHNVAISRDMKDMYAH